MRVLVTGAYGFIGRQLVAVLQNADFEVICAVRDIEQAQRYLPHLSYIQCDFSQDTDAAIWKPRLQGIDAVVNCVGILQSNKENIQSIHAKAPIALFRACEEQGVKCVLQISAQGACSDATTLYGQTKNQADEYLARSQLNWVILKPSLVYAKGSYGGSSLFRGLAALPGFIPVVGCGKQPFQPIHIDDLTSAIVYFLKENRQLRLTLDAVGPEVVTLQQLLTVYRQWLGFAKAKIIHIPVTLIKTGAKILNFFNKSVINTTALDMLQNANMSNPKPFADAVNFIPRSFKQGLSMMPSDVQDRWHARLYFLNPLLRISIALVWILSGLIPVVATPLQQNLDLLHRVGISGNFAYFVFYSSALLDFLLGVATLLKWKIKLIGYIQLFMISAYTLIISIFLPELWLDPFGSVTKNIPLLVAIMMMIALESER